MPTTTLPLSIGRRFPMINDYFQRIGECTFCFIPKGLGYWSNRLYETIFMGCIPVLLTDDVGLPFPHVIPWREMSIKWPMAEVDERIVAYLDWLVSTKPEKVRQMQQKVRDAACWLNYHSTDPKCNPYLAIMEQLLRKKLGFPKWSGVHWNTVPRVAAE